MHLVSPAFQEGKPIPSKFAYHGVTGGKNVSIPLTWSDAPEETKSFALSVIDPHPVAKNWIHWLVLNLPAGLTSLPEGSSGKGMPAGCKELFNSYGSAGYGGPQPPKGSGPHPYVTTLYALNVEHLDLTANTSLASFTMALEGKVLASARTTGLFER